MDETHRKGGLCTLCFVWYSSFTRNALIGFAFYTAKRLRPKAQVCFNPGKASIGNPTPTGLRPAVTLREIQISADATALRLKSDKACDPGDKAPTPISLLQTDHRRQHCRDQFTLI